MGRAMDVCVSRRAVFRTSFARASQAYETPRVHDAVAAAPSRTLRVLEDVCISSFLFTTSRDTSMPIPLVRIKICLMMSPPPTSGIPSRKFRLSCWCTTAWSASINSAPTSWKTCERLAVMPGRSVPFTLTRSASFAPHAELLNARAATPRWAATPRRITACIIAVSVKGFCEADR